MCVQYSANFNPVHRVSSQLCFVLRMVLKDVLMVKTFVCGKPITYL